MPPKSAKSSPIKAVKSPKAPAKEYKLLFVIQDLMPQFKDALYQQRGEWKGNMMELETLALFNDLRSQYKSRLSVTKALYKLARDGDIPPMASSNFNNAFKTITFPEAFFTTDFKTTIPARVATKKAAKREATTRSLKARIHELEEQLASASVGGSATGSDEEEEEEDDEDDEISVDAIETLIENHLEHQADLKAGK